MKIAERARRLQDLDQAMEVEAELKEAAIRNTESLLRSANYDVLAWREWLGLHPQRPMTVAEAAAGLI